MGSKLGVSKKMAGHLGMSLEDYIAKTSIGEKWCTGCKCWQPVGDFGSDRSRSDGLAATCKARRESDRRSKYVPRGRVSRAGKFLKPARDGDREQARARANQAVRSGLLRDQTFSPARTAATFTPLGSGDMSTTITTDMAPTTNSTSFRFVLRAMQRAAASGVR